MNLPEYNLSNLSLNQWKDLIQKNTPIYIKENQIKGFSNPQEATSAGFSPASVIKIIEISRGLMGQVEDPDLIRSLEYLLMKEITCLSDPYLKGQCEQILKQTHSTFFVKVQEILFLAPVNIISEKMNQELLSQLKDVTSVFRSRDGRFGVLFLQNAEIPNGFILKLPLDPLRHMIADRYYRKLGYITPEYSIVHRDTTTGRAIRECLQRTLSNDQKKDLRSSLKVPYFTVMNTVPGTTLRQIPIDKGRELLKDNRFLQAIGEVLFYDAVIGNGDRFLVSCNLGNSILDEENPADKILSLIDHEFALSSVTDSKRIKREVTSLLEGDDAIWNLAVRLKEAYKETYPEASVLFDQILIGVQLAKDNFKITFPVEERDIFEIPPCQLLRPQTTDRQLFNELRRYLLNLS